MKFYSSKNKTIIDENNQTIIIQGQNNSCIMVAVSNAFNMLDQSDIRTSRKRTRTLNTIFLGVKPNYFTNGITIKKEFDKQIIPQINDTFDQFRIHKVKNISKSKVKNVNLKAHLLKYTKHGHKVIFLLSGLFMGHMVCVKDIGNRHINMTNGDRLLIDLCNHDYHIGCMYVISKKQTY